MMNSSICLGSLGNIYRNHCATNLNMWLPQCLKGSMFYRRKEHDRPNYCMGKLVWSYCCVVIDYKFCCLDLGHSFVEQGLVVCDLYNQCYSAMNSYKYA